MSDNTMKRCGTGLVQMDGEDEAQSVIVLGRNKSDLKAGTFMLMMNDGAEALAKMNLKPSEWSVMMMCISIMGFQNVVDSTQSYIGEKLEMEQSNVSRAIRGLKEKGLIVDVEVNGRKRFRVNAAIAWRGKTGRIYMETFEQDASLLPPEFGT